MMIHASFCVSYIKILVYYCLKHNMALTSLGNSHFLWVPGGVCAYSQHSLSKLFPVGTLETKGASSRPIPLGFLLEKDHRDAALNFGGFVSTCNACSLSNRPPNLLCEGDPWFCAGTVQHEPGGASEDSAWCRPDPQWAEPSQAALPGKCCLCGPHGLGRKGWARWALASAVPQMSGVLSRSWGNGIGDGQGYRACVLSTASCWFFRLLCEVGALCWRKRCLCRVNSRMGST